MADQPAPVTEPPLVIGTVTHDEPAPQRKQGSRWVPVVTALATGLLVGSAVTGGVVVATTDPSQSPEYQALAKDESAARDEVARLAEEVAMATEQARTARSEAAEQQSLLDEQERQLAEREAAVAAVEQRIVSTSIGQGVWTVGRDVEPGTYRTAEAVTGDCYWGIYTSGTNGDDIVENDIVTGGFPTVTLSVGQDFENNRCGTFIKQ
jgi:outer membrane murein-binding lipoprotein Lpp